MSTIIRPLYQSPTQPLPDPDREAWLGSPPPWRNHLHVAALDRAVPASDLADLRGSTYVPTSEEERDAVNLALWLRRPLLVTGAPGIGKSSLAYGIAKALGLGAPLRWEINSQTSLQDGLYRYDAVGHFRATRAAGASEEVSASDFLELGPLGTAFVPTRLPRVLLIDELDKASWDLPNNLLHIFEEGAFRIPELHQQRGEAKVRLVDSRDKDDRVTVTGAEVRVRHHPVVVITSNAEREFSPAFLRRCIRLQMHTLSRDVLQLVVAAKFANKSDLGDLAALLDRLGDDVETDVALQSIFAATVGGDLEQIRERLRRS